MHVVPDLHTGGAERHVVTLFSSLDPARFEPSVVCVGDEGALFGGLAEGGVPGVALHRGKRDAVRAGADLVGQMRRYRPDVVLTRGYSAELLGRVAAVLAGVPHRVVWAHHAMDIGDSTVVRRYADRVLDRVTDAYFGVAQAQRPFLIDYGFPGEKIRIVHNGVDAARFDPRDDRGVLASLGVAQDASVVGMLAALRPEKDHENLLRAMRIVVDALPQARLLIIGDGPRRPAIEALIAELGLEANVILTGNRSDVAAVLAALSVFTLSSWHEAFPMALLEAMSAGRASVCTDVGGVAELLDDGRTGYVVPSRDPQALAGRLLDVLRHPDAARRMGLAAREHVERHFTLARSVAGAEAAIEEVAGPAAAPGRRPVRLAVVLDVAGVGGVEVLLLNLFKAFDPAVVRPELICLKQGGAIADELRAAGFEVTVLDRRGRYDTATLPRLVRHLRRSRADAVLVAHHHRASLALGRIAAKLARVPVNLVAAHDMDLTSVGGRVLPGWAVRTLGISDALILLTRSQGEYLRREEGVGALPWENTYEVVIPNGIELPPRPNAADRAAARDVLGAGADDVVVGVVARFSAQKAQEVLLEAVASLRNEVPQLRVVLIGDGERRGELGDLTAALGIADRVRFLGIRRDVPALLPGLDVACLSSVHEGVPLALIEAMAAGLPVVATDCGSIRDIVGDGEQGFVVPVRDVPALADRLRRLAQDHPLRSSMGRSARERAEREFGLEHTVAGYQRLLTDLLDRSRSGRSAQLDRS